MTHREWPSRTTVDRFYAAFNARDLDTWIGLLDDGVEIAVDARRFRGREAARAYAEGIMRLYPGVVARDRRVVAASVDTIVSEFRLVNPATEVTPTAEAWRLDGIVCEVVQLDGNRIVSLHSYYQPSDTDRTDVAQVPSREEAARIAQEQTALRRVATLVARGVSQDELFAVVNRDIAALVDADVTSLMRFESDDTMTLLAAWGETEEPFPVGERRRLDAELRAVRDTGRATRHLGSRSSVGVPILVEGRVWGVSVAASLRPEPLAADAESRVAGFTELVGTAIANAENKAKLTASRARVVATADETRRRLQRDVHDSAQQRLVHTIIALKLARSRIVDGGDAIALIDEALLHAERASRDLRDVVRGILPAALTRGGLRSGLESLVDELALPVDVRVTATGMPTSVETTAYFVVAEALTNVVKHARATHATVEVTAHGDELRIEVRDDGVGGADPARGTGLMGLFDRVDAAEGVFTITSPIGHGTTVQASLLIPSR